MKSKYDSVLKVRKQQLDKAELNLNKARARLLEHERALELANLDFINLCALPQAGDTNVLRQSLDLLNVAKEAKERAAEKVELSHKEIAHYQHLYKKANLEYEKIKYLRTEEFKKLKEELKRAEDKFMDEIAVSRFFNGEKDE